MNNPLTIDLTIDALADCGVANGAATVNVFNGSGSYYYTWSDNGTTQTRTDLAAIYYEITVTDSLTGCQIDTFFTMTENVPAATIVVNSCGYSNCNYT